VSSDRSLIITIDGPAGSGKTSAARGVAQHLGLSVLDTGSMYRTAALLALREGIDPSDGKTIAARVAELGIEVDFSTAPPEVRLDGICVGDSIRTTEVEAIVSEVAAQPEVRTALVEAQRGISRQHPRLVTEGRDQGSVVFPDAAVRFFLTATAARRAYRRCSQVEARGGHAEEASVRKGIEQRDHLDASRPDGPLVRPEGAIEIDTDKLSLQEVVLRIVSEVQRHVSGDTDRQP
jgi:cytidylate kinase